MFVRRSFEHEPVVGKPIKSWSLHDDSADANAQLVGHCEMISKATYITDSPHRSCAQRYCETQGQSGKFEPDFTMSDSEAHHGDHTALTRQVTFTDSLPHDELNPRETFAERLSAVRDKKGFVVDMDGVIYQVSWLSSRPCTFAAYG
jgi:hypothetical protein